MKLAVQQSEVQRRETIAALRRQEATGLKIRAGVSGVLQEVPVQVGQRIGPGTNLARVVDPTRLKAQLQIAETQIRDVVIGQKAEIDTRQAPPTHGRVVRIDPCPPRRRNARRMGLSERRRQRRDRQRAIRGRRRHSLSLGLDVVGPVLDH